MKPPKRAGNMEYEKVTTDDFVSGIIEDINYDPEHTFKGFGKDASGKDKPDTKAAAVRLKFKLEGYQYSHYSRWMRFNYGEKANLYLKFLVPLVEGAKPDMDFDLDQLRLLPVKTLWSEKNDFQSVETIRPIGKKVVPLNVFTPAAQIAETHEDHDAIED
jgi:hypothetical protein